MKINNMFSLTLCCVLVASSTAAHACGDYGSSTWFESASKLAWRDASTPTVESWGLDTQTSPTQAANSQSHMGQSHMGQSSLGRKSAWLFPFLQNTRIQHDLALRITLALVAAALALTILNRQRGKLEREPDGCPLEIPARQARMVSAGLQDRLPYSEAL